MSLATVAIAAALLLAGPAFAQPSEAQRLSRSVAHDLISALDLKAMLMQSEPSLEHSFDSFNARPEWPGLMRVAAHETFDSDLPAIEQMFAGALAQRFTVGELQAAVAFFKSPGGEYALAVVAAQSRNQAAPPISVLQKQSMRAFARNADGASFIHKFADLNAIMPSLEQDFIALIMPDLLIRFGEKAKAAEAARQGQ
ncbi:MAG TPA: DUF2059 domain-containing protein [Caulobacteraceae bacterium]|nr:DUF2059 domain-containing protein [Caulobacteraceae bacterium]